MMTRRPVETGRGRWPPPTATARARPYQPQPRVLPQTYHMKLYLLMLSRTPWVWRFLANILHRGAIDKYTYMFNLMFHFKMLTRTPWVCLWPALILYKGALNKVNL